MKILCLLRLTFPSRQQKKQFSISLFFTQMKNIREDVESRQSPPSMPIKVPNTAIFKIPNSLQEQESSSGMGRKYS